MKLTLRRNRFKNKPKPPKAPWRWPAFVLQWRTYLRRGALLLLVLGALAALTWALERKGWAAGRIFRFWDPNYYRTYLEQQGQPKGFMSVQQEVTRALARVGDFCDVPRDDPNYRRKTSGLARDSIDNETPAFVVQDRHYVSARWPGDAHTFAKTFTRMLK